MKDKVIRALLIEDDPDDTLLLMQMLAQPGWPALRFTLECVDTLKAGLEILSKRETEVVLLDLMLPDSRGIATVEKVRSHFLDVPIVVLTGLRDEELGLQALTHGAQDYQIKGNLDSHALKRTLSYAVERHRLLIRMEGLIEKSPDGLVVLDSKRMVRYVNSAASALIGQPDSEILGKPLPYPLPATPSGEIKLPIPGEADGSRIIEIRCTDIEWKDSLATLASLRDITELRRIEQLKAEVKERRRMDKLKDELVSAISHEMRSPLTIIKAAVGNLRDGLTGPLSVPQTKLVTLMSKNALRLEKIVNNILDLSRLESGRAVIHYCPLDLNELIREVVRGFRLLSRENRILVQEELSPNLPEVSADPDLIEQVLNNLIENALRFTETKIMIRTQLGSQNQQAQVSVIDDGKGIPNDRIKDLFNKFVQVQRSTRGRDYKGTGLGLAICKEIVERHRGQIWLESQEGQGTQVHFLLPSFNPSRYSHEPPDRETAHRDG